MIAARPTSARFGILIPCRNEARVVERKLGNLARLSWPPGEHRVVLVDDGSTDGTGDLARSSAARLFEGSAVEVCVVRNRVRAGKSGAVATGWDELGGSADLVVLTDADVVLRPDALIQLARAFDSDPDLALACGAQELVRDLAGDGSCRGARGGAPEPAAGLYDRWTSAVRALESCGGRLFSVHGQLLAWRASPAMLPAAGRPADDLDLMFAARARGGRVRRIRDARFLEVRTGRAEQALRRARAYFEALRGRRRPLGPGVLDRLQWGFYRTAPAAAPEAFGALLLVALPVAGLLGGPAAAAGTAVLLAAALASPAGRRLVRLLALIRTARRSEARARTSDRWEMQRP